MKIITILLTLLTAVSAFGQSIKYNVSFPNAVHHEAEITVTYEGYNKEVLEARMSISSPGRYAIHEFAKNVYNFKAVDRTGKELNVTRPNPYQWDVSGHDGTIVITYTLFADRAGGTYTGIDESHAHMNMPATYMWARGLDDKPINITFDLRTDLGWKVATQLKHESENTYSAPNLQYFMDSPTEISNFTLREWTVDGKNIRLAIHHVDTDNDEDIDAYTEMVKKVVNEQKEVYGKLPEFEFGEYTFIADYLPWVSGDGMEHRNSTILASTANLKQSANRVLGTAAHEFFHCWNVERVRPKSLEPFNFEHANMSRELWYAEGFTSYYTPLTIRRAGLSTDKQFAASMGGTINRIVNSPGRQFFSAAEMSMQAPFVDASTSIDPTNRGNTFISYYTWGAGIGLGLDLTLRTRFPGKDLDGYMQAVWNNHGKTEKSYTVEDLESTLANYSGNLSFAADFFDKYIRGGEVVDYSDLLSNAGFLFIKSNADKPVHGLNLRKVRNQVVVAGYPNIGSSGYEAGIDKGAVILSINGNPVSETKDMQTALMGKKPGDTLTIEFTQRGTKKTAELFLKGDQRISVVPYEDSMMELSEEAKAFRKAWLGSKAGY